MRAMGFMTLPRLLLLCCIAMLANAAEIDPKLYASAFEVNHPTWTKIAELVAAAVPAGSKVLDLGAGPGEPTTTMARAMPQHKFVATDKQPPMLEKAKKRTEGLSNVEHAVASAEDLSSFPDASFEAVTGCYVLMFVDVSKALAEVARVLKPGGVAFFSVWDEAALYSLTRAALKEVYVRKAWKGTVPPIPVNPVALSTTEPELARSTIEKELTAMQPAPLKITSTEDISYNMPMGTVQELCAVSFIYATPFDQIAAANDSSESEIKEAFCAVFEELAAVRRVSGKKDGNAKIYTLEKLQAPREEF
jgi:ubiquinone/menaquinone biosynthesis C-methylase UbiE